MDDLAPPTMPAGWYPDPKMADTQRYWDGERWSDHVAPANAAPAADLEARRQSSNLETWGWLGAIFLTPVGFVIAIVMMSRGQSAGRAAMMLALSVVMTLLGAMAVINGASTS